MFKSVVYSLASFVLVTFVAIFNLDRVAPPETDKANWHAYLTESELKHPLAKYWFNKAPVSSEVLDALLGPPLQESEVLNWEDRFDLIEPKLESAETGWAKLADGSAYIAVNTFFPGATAEMVDWWFEWAQEKEDIRYKIWYPGAHYAMAQRPTDGAPVYAYPKPYWGKSRFPVEDVGVGVSRLRLDFVAPTEFGFGQLPEGSTMLAVRVGLPNGLFKTTDMIHYVKPVDGGVEMRSRFWVARKFEAMTGGAGIAAALLNNRLAKQMILPGELPLALGLHCANEYAQLASFLPDLFAQYGPGVAH